MPYKDKNKEREYRKKYREQHKEEQKKYAKENREELNEYRKEWRKKNPERNKLSQSKYYRTDRGRFIAAKHAAKEREKTFTISFEEYQKIISEPCYYCDGKFGKQITTGSGLDRLNNSIGYEINNIRSCCWTCNKIKNDSLTTEETMVAVRAVLEYRSKITYD